MFVTMHTLCLLSWMLNFYTKQNFQLIPLNFVVLSNEPKYKGHHTNRNKIFTCWGASLPVTNDIKFSSAMVIVQSALPVRGCPWYTSPALGDFMSIAVRQIIKSTINSEVKLLQDCLLPLVLVFRAQSLVNSRSLIMSLTALVIVSLFIHWRLIPS